MPGMCNIRYFTPGAVGTGRLLLAGGLRRLASLRTASKKEETASASSTFEAGMKQVFEAPRPSDLETSSAQHAACDAVGACCRSGKLLPRRRSPSDQRTACFSSSFAIAAFRGQSSQVCGMTPDMTH